MKKLVTSLKAILIGGLALCSTVTNAQFTGSYAFPQNTTYSYGRMPSSPSDQDALDSYNYWKQNFVTSGCGEQRVIWDYYNGGRGATDRSESVSEGIAYGMLLSAYAGDKPLFDDLWAYYKKFRNGNGVMNWRIQNCGVKGANGASDAELDVAMALIVASHQWQSDAYMNDAKDMIRIVREKEFDGNVLKPGDQFGGQSLTNPSYFSPAYYRVFATIEPNYASFWTGAADKGYDIIDKVGGSNGLVPDWCDGNGNLTSASNQYEEDGKFFIFDAIRTPFRSAIDYVWHGNIRGQQYCSKVVDWCYGKYNGGTEGLDSKYDLNGNSHGGGHSNTFVSCFAMASMASGGTSGNYSENNYQSFLDRGYTDNENTQPGYGQYFNATFKVLSQFVLSGNFYLPPPDACNAPTLGNDVSLCSGNITLDAGISGVNYEWRKDGSPIIGAPNSKTYQVSTAGSYEVVTVDGSGCTRRDKIEVYPDLLEADFSYTVGPGTVILQNTTQGGVTSSSWSDGTVFETEYDANYSYSGDGTADITLTVNNSGFGCSDVSTKTKTIVLGGNGWTVDDFNISSVSTPWIPNTTSYAALPKIKCSAEATKADCPNNPCGLFEVTVKAGASQWDPFGVNFNDGATPTGDPIQTPVDLTATPFVSMRVRASADVELGIGLNDGTVTSSRIKATLPANEWVVLSANELDFSTGATAQGWNEDLQKMVDVDYSTIGAIQFFPNEYVTFAGTIEIDWIIVGAKSLDAPTWDIKRDVDGFPVYEDPDGDEIFTTVPSWLPEVTACNDMVVVDALTCTASEVRWYSGSALIGTGFDKELAPGTYTVELVNQGGVTTDEVTVVEANLTPDFAITTENYSAWFTNQSVGATTWSWNFGDATPANTTDEIAYHNYETAGEDTYNVTLTINNAECGTTDNITKQVVIECTLFPADPIITQTVFSGCEGDLVTYTISPVEYAGSYGWFYGDTDPLGDDTIITITLGTDGPLTIQAYNACGNGATTKDIDVTSAPIANFTVVEDFANKIDFTATPVETTAYDWAFGDGATDEGANVSHTFATSNIYNVCLNVANACGSDELCKDVSASITGLSNFDAAGNVNVFPTAVASELNVILPGAAIISVTDVLGNTLSETNIIDQGSINVSDLNAGMYMLSIEQNGETVTKRFVKQ